MIQKILSSTNKKLRVKSKPVKKIDKKILAIIKDLKDTLATQKDPEGVGLAAPQIGKNVQIFFASYHNFERVVINPKVISIAKSKSINKKKSHEILEGCLSLPNYYGPLKRAKSVEVEYLNEKGEKKKEKFEDFNAQIILHEIDHLKGILFIDHILKEKKPLYKLEDGEWKEVELI